MNIFVDNYIYPCCQLVQILYNRAMDTDLKTIKDDIKDLFDTNLHKLFLHWSSFIVKKIKIINFYNS